MLAFLWAFLLALLPALLFGFPVGFPFGFPLASLQIFGTTYPPLIQWGVSCFRRFEKCVPWTGVRACGNFILVRLLNIPSRGKADGRIEKGAYILSTLSLCTFRLSFWLSFGFSVGFPFLFPFGFPFRFPFGVLVGFPFGIPCGIPFVFPCLSIFHEQ